MTFPSGPVSILDLLFKTFENITTYIIKDKNVLTSKLHKEV